MRHGHEAAQRTNRADIWEREEGSDDRQLAEKVEDDGEKVAGSVEGENRLSRGDSDGSQLCQVLQGRGTDPKRFRKPKASMQTPTNGHCCERRRARRLRKMMSRQSASTFAFESFSQRVTSGRFRDAP